MLDNFEIILKMKVHDIINNYLYTLIIMLGKHMNWDCSNKLECIAILVLNINQVIKAMLFQSFITKLIFNHRLVLIYEFMRKHDSKNAL